MYIKIKHIKQFFLVSAIIFFAGFNYLTYVKADSTLASASCDKSTDSDCDGLTNTEEVLYKTNANNSDTDGDGYSDGVEVKSGYNPTIAAPDDRSVESVNSEKILTNQLESTASTNTLTQNIQDFIASKGNQTISSSDINEFVTNDFTNKLGTAITIDSLPEIDQSSIKLLNQAYASLSSDERAEQITKDSSRYFTTLFYLIISNSPTPITSKDDIASFNKNFLTHVYSLSSANPDYAYFSELGSRLDSLLIQLSDVEVPETIMPMHIKMIRIVKGFLSLRDNADDYTDPVSKMALLSRIQALSKISTDFLNNDVANYFNQF
ncbi:MAG: hypothetical protein HGA36_00815 [Candidatus Moranbacteria bacterium]|nr:hypothetical protein [Candidatus Moranbacteria bacterium]